MIRSAVSFALTTLLIASIAFAQTPPAQGSPGQGSSEQSPTAPSPTAPDATAPGPSAQAQPSPTPPPPSPAVPPLPQRVPKVQVFGGYSFFYAGLGNLNSTNFDVDLNLFPNTLVTKNNFNGWNAEAQYNFGAWVGAVVDVSGYLGLPFTPAPGVGGLPSGSSYSILAGPVVTYRNWKHFAPFAHALFGWNRTSIGASTLTGVVYPSTALVPLSSTATSFNDFVMAFGGGVDYQLTHHFDVRLVQAEWFHTSLNLNSFYGTAFSSTLVQGFPTKERNVRVSTGIVVKF